MIQYYDFSPGRFVGLRFLCPELRNHIMISNHISNHYNNYIRKNLIFKLDFYLNILFIYNAIFLYVLKSI